MKFRLGKTIKNAGWLTGGKIAEMLIGFIISIFTANMLGRASMGSLDYGLAYAAFFTSVSSLGINSVLVKEFVDKEYGEGTILGTSLILRVVAAVFSAFTIFAVTMIADMGDWSTILVVVLASLRLVFQSCEVFLHWFHARLESKIPAIALLIAYFFTSIYKVVLLVLGSGVEWFAISTSIDYILIGGFLLLLYVIKKGERLRFSFRYAWKLLKKSCHFILPALMVSIYAQTDKLMLHKMLGEEFLADYARAVTICNLWVFVLTAIIDSVNPSIMQAKKDGDQALFEKRNKQLYAIIFYVSIAVSALLCIFAKLIIGILYPDYTGAVAPLRVITWYTAFSFIGMASGAWIVCENKQKYLIWVYAASAVVNVILNVLLIRWLGTVGAALASLAAQITTSFIFPAIFPPLRPNAKLILDAVLLKGILPEKIRLRLVAFVKIAFVYLVAFGAGVMTYCCLPWAVWLRLLVADVVATVVVFMYSVFFRNASVYDPYWSVQPIVIVAILCAQKPFSVSWLLPLIAVCVWGVRLTANWAYTFKGMDHQDWRYTQLKEKTGLFYPLVNFFGIHMVPTLVVYGCLLPIVFVIESGVVFNPWSIPFFVLSIFAAIWQGIADIQMHKFRKEGQGGFIRIGLWKYSRHPNYLGEILMWWGIAWYVFVLMPSAWYLLFGALANTLLFLFVSIPLADGRQSKKEGFTAYKNRTRMLLPIPKIFKKY